MPVPSALSFLGIAKEVTKGTGVAATHYIPVKTLDPLDNVTYLTDEGMRGSMVKDYGEIAGVKHSEIDLGGDVFADTIGWLVAAILGDVTTSGAAPLSHAVSVKNDADGQPKAYSLTDFYGFTIATPARRYPGAQLSELSLKFNADGMLEWTAKAVGFPSEKVAKPTQSFTGVTPTPAWEGITTIGGSAAGIMQSGEFNIKRDVAAIDVVDGTQAPYKVWAGAVEVDGKLTVVYEDETEMDRFLNNTQPSLDLAFSHGAGATQAGLTLHANKIAYVAAPPKRGETFMQLDIDWRAIANTTDAGATGGYSPCKVTAINQIASGTYV